MKENRKTEIYNAAHETARLAMGSSNHTSFELGANWADQHPSKELISEILKTLQIVKYENRDKSSIIDMNPYPYTDETIVKQIQDHFYKSLY